MGAASSGLLECQVASALPAVVVATAGFPLQTPSNLALRYFAVASSPSGTAGSGIWLHVCSSS